MCISNERIEWYTSVTFFKVYHREPCQCGAEICPTSAGTHIAVRPSREFI